MVPSGSLSTKCTLYITFTAQLESTTNNTHNNTLGQVTISEFGMPVATSGQ